jgi:hypothetical protein
MSHLYYVGHIDDADRKAVKEYSFGKVEWHRIVNMYLRADNNWDLVKKYSQGTSEADVKEIIAALDAVAAKGRASEDLILWRGYGHGLRNNPVESPRSKIMKLGHQAYGKVYRECGFVSCDIDGVTYKDFASGGFSAEVIVPAHEVNLIDVDYILGKEWESEIIIDRGFPFRVNQVGIEYKQPYIMVVDPWASVNI